MRCHDATRRCLVLALCLAIPGAVAGSQEAEQPTDYLSLAQGALPVRIDGPGQELGMGAEQLLEAIDGDGRGFSLTPKGGGPETSVALVYALPAATTFTEFAVPNVLETPSPSQTFVREIEVSGSDSGPDGPFEPLARATLTTHDVAGEVTVIAASAEHAVRWVRVALTGGIDVQRDRTFFEFSEIIGRGRQEGVALSEAFTGKWRGRGVRLELRQEGVRVNGCYDRNGDLTGTVSGNILRATGADRTSGVQSAFVLVAGEDGAITGVASTNGAPFRLYSGESDPALITECSEQAVEQLGCGSIVHGINFDFDSATIRPESSGHLDELAAGLQAATAATITIVGHTSSEGSDAYNEQLSQRRAEAVVTALIERGIDASRMAADGRGESEPIADNATEAGRALNRRVEIACR